MEEIYILSDGSQVDISDYSQFDKTNFLIENPDAKKQKGVTKSAGVTSKKNQALKKNTGFNSVNGSSGSKTFRLATESDFETAQKKGILPPPSTQPKVNIEEDIYDIASNSEKPNAKKRFEFKSKEKVKLPGQRTAQYLSGKTNIGSEEKLQDLVDNALDNPKTGELGYINKHKIEQAKKRIQETDSDLQHPYLYYSSYNQEQPDTFVQDNFNTKELENLGINTQDFDGFLNKKGYKKDFLEKESKGLFTGTGKSVWSGYDIGLAKELAKKKLLNMYMEDMQQRDVTKQDLNQDIEIAIGAREEKDVVNNELFDKNGIAKYVEKNFPILTQTLKDRDAENAKIYENAKKGGSDFFSWETPGKMARAGWNAIKDRTAQFSATVYNTIGMEGTAEGIRMLDEENKLVRPDTRDISYVSGKSTEYDNTKYIVDSRGEVYDADSKIRVTDLLTEGSYKQIVKDAEYGPSDWIFSVQGSAVQTSGVMADMLLQAALTKGVGELGAIASETRIAMNIAKPTSRFTSLVNDTSQLLKKVPIDRVVGYSTIAQSALGYSQGYEDTLKAARDNGINDKDAFELAANAAQRMAVLYAATAEINPQTNVVENVFGSKNIVKKAIEQYTKTGKKGFINYIDDVIKNAPKNIIEFAEEGAKEVVQENIQQIGETGVNAMTNRDAGKKIVNDVMTGDDFMNTSILSFMSSGLISKLKLPNLHTSNDATDDLRSLSTLAKNQKQFNKTIDELEVRKVFTPEQVQTLKSDVKIYSDNINKLSKTVPAEIAMPIMREMDKRDKLLSEKKTLDPVFHEEIDEKIFTIEEKIRDIVFENNLKTKNEAISKAIKKGVVKNIEMKTFSSTKELEDYLVNEINMPKEEAERNARQGGFMLDESNLKQYSVDPSTIKPGQKMILVNEEIGHNLGASEIVQHEFLHGLIHETIKGDTEAQRLLGVALSKEIMKLKDLVDLKGDKQTPVPESFVRRFSKYVNMYQKYIAKEAARLELGDITKQEHDARVEQYLGNQWEEVLTLYSDAISNGSVKYEEGTFSKLKDIIRQVLQYLGIKDIEFHSGKDVYNFIKDYNKSVESGNWGKAMKKLGNEGALINRDALRKETGINVNKIEEKKQVKSQPKFSLGNRKSSDEIKESINKRYNKEQWSTGSNFKDTNPAIDRVMYDILSDYDYIIKGKSRSLGYSNLPDFSEMDMVSETQIALIPHIRNFNKEFFEKREEYKKELEAKGLDPKSKEFKDKVEEQDEKGYKGKKGTVKENKDLNAWINSQLVNKMGNALRTGNVTTQKFTEDIEGEMFKESSISDGFGGDEGYLMDEGDNIFEEENDFQVEQDELAVLLRDPVFNFVDEQGRPIDIETVPFGSNFVTEISDPTIAANKKLKTETDPNKIADLKRQLRDLERGLELQAKEELTFEEKEELKKLKSFKSYDLSTGMMVNTFEALSVKDTPAKIITDEVGREILRSPNVETLEYRNFKDRLSDLSKTMARRMTFKNGPEIESFMYNNWKLIYDVINHPVDPVTGQSSYASKKLPPRLKELDDKGNIKKIENIDRTKFLQSFYGIEEASRIINTYGVDNSKEDLSKFEDPEINEKTGNKLVPTAYFDRRTALMELFGDVMVLQEARRLLRQPDFLDRVAEKNTNLYNELKDDITRTRVLNDMARGKSSTVKFSLAENKENKQFLNKFPELTNSKEYKEFLNSIGDIYHSGSNIEKYFNKHKTKVIWFTNGEPERGYGDGTVYKSKVSDLPGAIIIPDMNRAGLNWGERFANKFPKLNIAMYKDQYKEQTKNNLNEKRVKMSFEEFYKNEKDFNFGPNITWLMQPENIKYADEVLLEWVKAYSEDDDYYFEQSEGYPKNEDGSMGKLTELIVVGPMSGYKIQKENKEGSYNDIKFSLAEEGNGDISTFLGGLVFGEQWVVARDFDKAVERGKIPSNTKITFKVPSRSKFNDKSTAYFIITKVAEGYNDFEFTVKKNANGPLTRQVLDALDYKSKEYQENLDRNNNLEKTMNEFIEENKGVKAEDVISPETAKNLGKNIGKHEIYLPAGDEDFLGLMYKLASGKGKKGEKQLQFFIDNLLKPYSDAMLNLMKARNTMYKDWKELINVKYKGITKKLKKDCGYGGYTNDQAVRVYLWSVARYEIPGLDKKDIFHLIEVVRNNPELRKFAQDVSLLSKQPNGYIEPDSNWGFGTVVSDMHNIISKKNREKYLEHWQNNVDKIFSKENMSKIEAVYGRVYAKALKNMLARMKSGTNRSEGTSDAMLNWINGSTAVTMFLNMRSAILQTIGSVNYINTSDNNILKAGATLLNVPQYTKDFFTIWNSDYLKDRRSGLMNDVAEAELAQLMNDPRNKSMLDKFKAANYWILKKGFGPTRFADSFAIAFGGAGFYRNRINTYLKQGMTNEEAEKATMRDFYNTSEISQQSADVSKISANQASVKGRLILAFQNTPLQYSRIIKKSVIDLAKGRGSVPNNIAKIVYYSAVQNAIFNMLQNALFAMVWDDDDDEKFDKAKYRAIDGTLDTLLRGSGMKGAILATIKNAIIKWYEKSGDPKGYGDVILELANISPSIGIKARVLTKSYKTFEYNKDEIFYKGFSLDNTYALESLTSLTSATTNFPADRLYQKIDNVSNALDSDYETWQRIFFLLGYNEWNLGVGESSPVQITPSGMLKISPLKTSSLKTPRLK